MKTIVGIFAHPDDEAFGPGGTLAKLAQENTVYLICVTNGDAGQNDTNSTNNLGDIRQAELSQAARVLGIKDVFFLGYKDGHLCNALYHEIAGKIQQKLIELQADEVMTFELHGVSGHIDHIAVSFITTYVFTKLPQLQKLWYFCLREEERKKLKEYFIYFPPGYTKEQVDKIVETAEVWEKKVAAMQAHTSQKQDVERVLGNQSILPKEEYFIVVEREGRWF